MNRKQFAVIVAAVLAAPGAAVARAADPCAAERRRVQTLTRRLVELGCPNPQRAAQCAETGAQLAEATADLAECEAA